MRQYNDRIYVTKIPNLYSAKDCQIHRIQTYLNNLHQKSYRICTLSYTGRSISTSKEVLVPLPVSYPSKMNKIGSYTKNNIIITVLTFINF